MGFLKGTAGFVRFSTEGELPEPFWDFVAERVAAFSFKDIDDTYDEFSIGWVSIHNMFDSEFNFAAYANGDYVTLALRIDERKVAPAILKKFIDKEEERIKKEKQIHKISRSMRTEIKERMRVELMRRAIPIPSVYELCWNVADSTLLFFNTSSKAHTLLEDLFKETFGLTLTQQIPYNTAEHLLDGDDITSLARISPAVFV
ncbi:MAG: recombination-associated protein RdgC [Desulfobulbaceae bacterium]|uniref:Recombination-associated protein RdgC n=1 Tax=Candidatus Desulfatifera sulfidica TaxID=2841691 RepID=A0A8J6NAR0_9BACT|nr:recombination-associated protein RdgC [Candidatus Desulfatifera sulfidica]